MTDHACIYIAMCLTEAKRVEAVLAHIGADYTLMMSRCALYIPGLLRTRYAGATFHVPPRQARACRLALSEARLALGLIEEA